MSTHRKTVTKTISFSKTQDDKEKIYYLYWQRLCSIEEIQHYFKGKYTYRDVQNIIRAKRQEYYDKESKNGR